MKSPHSSLVSMALLAPLFIAGCGFLSSGTTYEFEDEGQLCLGDPSHFGDHEDYQFEPGEPIEVSVIFDDCRSSSCTEFHDAHCSITLDDQVLTVTSEGSLTDTSSRSGRRTACTSDCAMYSTTCVGPALDEGSYTLVHGEQVHQVEVVDDQPVPKCYGDGS